LKLTVFFEEPFWVGIAEETDGTELRAFRHVFGAEPDDSTVAAFICQRLVPLLQSPVPTVTVGPPRERRCNPKRRLREAAREMRRPGVGTFAQEAIKREREHRKATARRLSRQEKDAQADRKRAIAVRKAKAKHRGR